MYTVTGPAYAMRRISDVCCNDVYHFRVRFKYDTPYYEISMNETRMLTVSILDEMIPRQYYSAEVECAATVHRPMYYSITICTATLCSRTYDALPVLGNKYIEPGKWPSAARPGYSTSESES